MMSHAHPRSFEALVTGHVLGPRDGEHRAASHLSASPAASQRIGWGPKNSSMFHLRPLEMKKQKEELASTNPEVPAVFLFLDPEAFGTVGPWTTGLTRGPPSSPFGKLGCTQFA